MRRLLCFQLVVVGLVCGTDSGLAATLQTIARIDPPGSTATFATGINQQGQIVGYFSGLNESGAGKHYGFLLDNGVFTAIDVPGAFGTHATAINDRGQIVGDSYLGPTRSVGFLLS